MKHITPSDAWASLLNGEQQVKTKFGFFALGDAFQITGECKAYEDQIVLVEHRGNHQYNHWGHRCHKDKCQYQPTITTNGDDGCGYVN